MAKRRKSKVALPAPPRRRMYEGATIGRLTTDWVTSSTSADAKINSSLIRLRNRARQLCRDNPYARQALRAIAANVIGSGVRMQAQVMRQRGGRQDQVINDAIEAAWAEWCRPTTCHVAGQLAFNEIERLAVTAMAESGEVFIRLVPQAFGSGLTPLALEVIEADLLDEGKTSGPDPSGNEWRMGVRVDMWGRPITYAFRSRHPGDLTNGVGWKIIEIPADQIIHLKITERPGQTRGVTWFAAAVKQLHHLGGYQDAEVIRARATASLMGFITNDEGEVTADGVVEGERVTNFEPGVFKYLKPGERVEVPQLGSPNTNFETFMRAVLRSVAASIGVSYETVSRDFSQSNYSSSRLSLLEDRENWRMIQNYMITHLHRAVFERWLDAAAAVGAVILPNYTQLRSRYQAVRWFPRGWGWVDPEKEVASYKDAVRCGFMTQAQVVAELGGDLHELARARAEEVGANNQLGLVFDTDPAQVRRDGMKQADQVEVDSLPTEAEAPADGSAAT
jgi:lambda family phage portal protein